MRKRLALTRSAIFITVYTLVLGIPFYLYYLGLKLTALVFAILLASFGPGAYGLMRKKSEESIIGQQQKYQNTLLEASKRLSRLKNEEEVVQTINKIIYVAMSLKSCAVYLKQADTFRMIDKMGTDARYAKEFPLEHPVVVMVEKYGILSADDKKKNLGRQTQQAEDFFNQHAGRLVVPVTYDDRLIAMFILGQKENDLSFSANDHEIMHIIAINTALTIENSRFHNEIKKAQAHLFHAEKMATIGTMADGLSHQINNRFHALGFIAGDALETIKEKLSQPGLAEEMRIFCLEMEKSLSRIQENVTQGGEIVRSLMRYTRQGQDALSEVDVNQVVDASYEMAQFKMKKQGILLEKKYDASQLPKVKGNPTQLQEVFFNIIDNAHDSTRQRKTELAEEGYQPILMLHAQRRDHYLEITFEDNGMGVKEEDKMKIFTPFFSTKVPNQNAMGIGLYVVHKIIEENHGGKVVLDSEYKKGARVRVYLPLV